MRINILIGFKSTVALDFKGRMPFMLAEIEGLNAELERIRRPALGAQA